MDGMDVAVIGSRRGSRHHGGVHCRLIAMPRSAADGRKRDLVARAVNDLEASLAEDRGLPVAGAASGTRSGGS